ncbi:hypothetical protein DFQ28_000713 [Apophysomyces sp. BC1034]|nr:hypothetical protein DFQ30_000538 [Apophysomyces sp. BC1015]KAG0180802.1 hypothetical protein DFQ29_010122 [Apophysomyces sp. BC1021]KAG0191220.1 hypothetical protein DFQ28_000713 [Apophysomyces sp. BC1034]
MARTFLILLLFVFCASAQDILRPIKYYELNITSGQLNPDCSNYTGHALLVNDQIPAPAIKITEGDRVHITVRNNQPANQGNDSAVTIHFHGVRQYGSTSSDGVPFLTQYPIQPGEHHVYEFTVVNQAGTYFYHAHVGLQEGTVFGAFIVYESDQANPNHHKKLMAGPHEYDEDRLVMLSEWWHRDRVDYEKYLLGPTFSGIPEADSILLNGRTMYENGQTSSRCKGYSTIDVKRGKTYRLRVVGATIFRTLSFGIENHKMTIIEVDGDLVKPYQTSVLEVASGQRFSVLVHADQAPGSEHTIGTGRRWAEGIPPYSNGMAVLRYNRRHIQAPKYIKNNITFSKEEPGWDWDQLEPVYGVDPIARRSPSRTIILRATDATLEDNSTRWYINGVSYQDPTTPILNQVIRNERKPASFHKLIDGYDPVLGTYPLQNREIVDFVLQSTRDTSKPLPCRSHPWHTHGHSHWELARGEGQYVEERDGNIRNVPYPIAKDVTLVYPTKDDKYHNGTATDPYVGCGWSKIRIIADNPGIWAMHCHNTPHMLMGMMIALEEAQELISTSKY